MENNLLYPEVEKVVEYNYLILTLLKAKKGDQQKTLSAAKLFQVIEECKFNRGDIYDKAVVLIKGIVQKHPFASGNRRTAFITTKDFIVKNHHTFGIKDNPDYVRVMLGIRENYYMDNEIRGWIINEAKSKGSN
ncbi:Fic family protein [Candidatus Woesearchaeota archaeon]|nr:Fic family protein [Candidatus Woesearchaeota archaeon]